MATKIPADVLARSSVTFSCKKCGTEHTFSYQDILEMIAATHMWKAKVKPTAGLEVIYKSSDGKVTRRIIIPQALGGAWLNGKREIREIDAICTLRHKVQTFVPSGIQEAFDAETGEKVDATEWLLAHMVE